jgi:NTE family protein
MNDFSEIKKILSEKIKNLYQPKWGLCLGGGGMRGMAHIGVIKAFEENKLYPDMIAGTSVGSIIGAAYALGINADKMYDYFIALRLSDVLHKSAESTRENFPLSLDGEILKHIVRNLCGDKNFEDTSVPFYAISADIANVKEIVYNSGKLDAACRASSSMPGVFSPYCADGMILVDGFVLNNLPADVLREKGAEIVISVDLKAAGIEGAKSARAVDVISATLDVMSNISSLKGAEMSDLVIKPDLKNFSIYTLKEDNLKKMYELGYEAALRNMNDITSLFLSN